MKLNIDFLKKKTVNPMTEFAPVDVIDDNNSLEYASRLYATCKDDVAISPDIVSMVIPNRPPIEDMSPYSAIAELNKWYKTQKRVSNAPSNWFVEKNYNTDIVVTPHGLSLDGEMVAAPAGVPGLNPDMVPQRIAADALFLYTSFPIGEKSHLSTAVNPNAAEQISFPYVNLTAERRSAEKNVRQGDTMIARDVIAQKLASSNQGVALTASILNKVYSNKHAISGGSAPKVIVDNYNANCGLLGLPTLPSMKIYERKSVDVPYTTAPSVIWATHTSSVNVRGQFRGRGNICCGYYRGDLPHHVIRTMDIVTDVIMTLKGFGVSVVEISGEPDVVRILLKNNFKVIDARHGKGICHSTSPVGVYSGSKVSYVKFLIPNLEPVVVTSAAIDAKLPMAYTFPTDVILSNKSRIYYAVRDYIRPNTTNQYPSICASDGLCIRTSQTMHTYTAVDYKTLMDRFSCAMAYRNRFFMLRILYSPLDPCRTYFSQFVYPRLVQGVSAYAVDAVSTASITDAKPINFTSLITPVDTMEAAPYDGKLQEYKDKFEKLRKEVADVDPKLWRLPDMVNDFSCIPALLPCLNIPPEIASFMSSCPLIVWNKLGTHYWKSEYDFNVFRDEITAEIEKYKSTHSADFEDETPDDSQGVPQAEEAPVTNLLQQFASSTKVSTAEYRQEVVHDKDKIA